jgi:hypothetical protein
MGAEHKVALIAGAIGALCITIAMLFGGSAQRRADQPRSKPETLLTQEEDKATDETESSGLSRTDLAPSTSPSGRADRSPNPAVDRAEDENVREETSSPVEQVTIEPIRQKPPPVETEIPSTGFNQERGWLPRKQVSDERPVYLAVFVEGKKVGYAIHKRSVTDGRVTTTEDTKITLNRAGTIFAIEANSTTVETLDGKPIEFRAVQATGASRWDVTGTVAPDGSVNATISQMGAQRKTAFTWPEGAVMGEGYRLLLMEAGLVQGTQCAARLFSPESLQAAEVTVTVGATQNIELLDTVERLTEITTALQVPSVGQAVTTSYVDDELRTLKSSVSYSGVRFEMIACSRELALGENEVLDLVEAVVVKSPETLGNTDTASSITYFLKTSASATLVIPEDHNQEVERLGDGKIRVTVKPVMASAGGRFPYEGQDRMLIEATKPTTYLQSDRKEVIELARRAVGETVDAAEAAFLIESFVSDYVKPSHSISYASAAEVAVDPRGDCSEYAVLTTAMCRAVGVPAQVVMGILYREQYGGFVPSTWTRVYIRDRWIGLDATFRGARSCGYDPGHIALTFGDGEYTELYRMGTLMGQIEIEGARVVHAIVESNPSSMLPKWPAFIGTEGINTGLMVLDCVNREWKDTHSRESGMERMLFPVNAFCRFCRFGASLCSERFGLG